MSKDPNMNDRDDDLHSQTYDLGYEIHGCYDHRSMMAYSNGGVDYVTEERILVVADVVCEGADGCDSAREGTGASLLGMEMRCSGDVVKAREDVQKSVGDGDDMKEEVVMKTRKRGYSKGRSVVGL